MKANPTNRRTQKAGKIGTDFCTLIFFSYIYNDLPCW
nr:MAG TPA: hypothetical protein [Caudoviricetes sp.]